MSKHILQGFILRAIDIYPLRRLDKFYYAIFLKFIWLSKLQKNADYSMCLYFTSKIELNLHKSNARKLKKLCFYIFIDVNVVFQALFMWYPELLVQTYSFCHVPSILYKNRLVDDFLLKQNI